MEKLTIVFMALLELAGVVLLTVAAILNSKPVADIAIVCMAAGCLPPVVDTIADILDEREEMNAD